MSRRVLFTTAISALLLAAPAAAQQRGTMEFGAFGSLGSFDNALSLTTGYGGGGRIGMFLTPRLSIEFEDAEMRASRPNGLANVNVGILSGRLVGVPIQAGRLSVLLGAGAGVSTETNFLHSYGVDVLAGAKLALGNNVALRVDGVVDWLANEDWKRYQSVRVGLSVYRHPHIETRAEPAAPLPQATAQREDSVSAAETRRLRAAAAELQALRDSLGNLPEGMTAADSAAMEARIQFAFDRSELTADARSILDDKVRVFRANPEVTIVITGHTDTMGTAPYNVALGTRRAEAARAYLVSNGIATSRIAIESRGDTQPLTQAAGIAGQGPNRRAVFHVVIGPDEEER